MGVRVAQACGIWFWIAFAFFFFVLFHQSSIVLPTRPVSYTHRHQHAVPLTTKQRMARSERAWRESVKLRYEMASSHPSYPKIPLFPAQKLSDFSNTPYTIWDFFPATYTCPHDIQRVGRLGDGGKWVCGMSLYESKAASASAVPTLAPDDGKAASNEIIIYSFGVNDESTFEDEMLARIPTAQIYAYDFSVDKFGPQLSRASASRAHFFKFGLGATDNKKDGIPFYTLQTLMEKNNHSYMDILKIDIEGGEYMALDSFMDAWEKEGVLPIGQVMIELHLVADEVVHFERFAKWWERLEGFGMRPAWFEPNLVGVTISEGKADPRCVEYVWVNARDQKSVLLGE
ncbi:major facilitator superfamily domain-containing 5 protein [Rutstroemia sp. NJR-2017a WRK4]|nr:major facilitator superfamily domain-containing 5 protein [Rutstroemia sp. NJR-2017a WRK4]